MGQVSRTANRQIGSIVDDTKHHFRSLACRDLGCLLDMLAAECAKLFKQARRQLLLNGLPEFVANAAMPAIRTHHSRRSSAPRRATIAPGSR